MASMSSRRTPSRGGNAHPGFEAEAQSIARRQGIPVSRARAELAAGTRRAGAAARRRNPRLSRVKGS